MAATANIIGAAWHSTLIGEAGGMLAAPIGEAGQILNANTKFSQIFFMFAALCLLAEFESQDKLYWRRIRKQKNRRSAENYSKRFAYCYRNRLISLLY